MEQNMVLETVEYDYHFEIKDPVSALTHFIAFGLALVGMPLLLVRASVYGCTLGSMVSLSVFMLSMIFLYGASTAYHTFHISERADKILKKIDHMMIFILIAGSYTPVCTIVLENSSGWKLLGLVWTIAGIGILFKALWVTCPKWVSSVIYIGMGWAALLSFDALIRNLDPHAFVWLVTGGVIYTIGGVIYALKLSALENYIKGFGAHELFHVFVMLGSFCHYMMMFLYITKVG